MKKKNRVKLSELVQPRKKTAIGGNLYDLGDLFKRCYSVSVNGCTEFYRRGVPKKLRAKVYSLRRTYRKVAGYDLKVAAAKGKGEMRDYEELYNRENPILSRISRTDSFVGITPLKKEGTLSDTLS